jgi:TfoX/Sxy family transcriptional regulator of competence genes
MNDERFASVVAAFARDLRVEAPSADDAVEGKGKFGSRGLKVDGKVFAMPSNGRLVVKLPAARVEALVASKKGQRYVLGARTMKEWVAVQDGTAATWRALAHEARDFVAGSDLKPAASTTSSRRALRPSSARARAKGRSRRRRGRPTGSPRA